MSWGEELARAKQTEAAAATVRTALDLVDPSSVDEVPMSIRGHVVLAQIEQWRGDQRAFIRELVAAREAAERLEEQDMVAALNDELAKALVSR